MIKICASPDTEPHGAWGTSPRLDDFVALTAKDINATCVKVFLQRRDVLWARMHA